MAAEKTASVSLTDTGGGIHFQRGLDGPHSLMVTAPNASFAGDIGATTPLARFETAVGNGVNATTLVFDAISITVNGDILLNTGFELAFVPTLATIGVDGDLVVLSINGNFTMGQNQKMTVSGMLNLTLQGADKVASLGDVTTLDDMRVTVDPATGKIQLRTRAAGNVDDPDGTLSTDNGLDFVAGGRVFFNVAPVAVGGSPEFANADGQVDGAGTLSAFVQRASGAAITPVDLQPTPGAFRDYRASGPSNTDPSTAIAGSLPQESALETIVVAPYLNLVGREQLFRRLRIAARTLPGSQFVELVAGAMLWNDAQPTDPYFNGGRVLVERLATDLAEQALQAHETLVTDATPAQIKSTVAAAWAADTESHGQDKDPAAFPAFLHNTGHTASVGYLRSLYELHRPVVLMGPTAAELASFEQWFMDEYKPADMSDGDFHTAIAASRNLETPAQAGVVTGDDPGDGVLPVPKAVGVFGKPSDAVGEPSDMVLPVPTAP